MNKKLTITLSAILAMAGITAYFVSQPKNTPTDQYPWQGFYYKSVDEYLEEYGLPTEQLDQQSFILLSDGLAYDQNNIYYFNKVLKNEGQEKIDELKKDLFERYSKAYHGPQKDQWDSETFQILDIDGAIARDKNHAFYGGYILENIPKEQLQTLGHRLYSNGKNVYSGNDPLDLNLNTLTFDQGYVSDGKKVYTLSFFSTYMPIKNVSANSFKVINRQFTKDNQSFFYEGNQLANIDYATFKPFINHAVDKHRAYFFLNSSQISITYSIDYDSYEEIDRYYAKDKNYLYHQGQRVHGVDPKNLATNQFGALHDGKHVISGTAIIMNSDPETYQRYKDMAYAKDKNSIYYADKKILGSHGPSFEFLTKEKYGKAYVRDKNYIYKEGKPIEGLDSASFEIISDDWFKDKESVYYRASKITEADPATFEVIDSDFARDKNNLYSVFAGSYEAIKSIRDPLSFQKVDSPYYKDKEHVYYNHVSAFYPLRGIDPESFKVLSIGYSKDKSNVYFKANTPLYTSPFITDADVATFEIIERPYGEQLSESGNYYETYNRDYGKDAKGCFVEGIRGDCPKDEE